MYCRYVDGGVKIQTFCPQLCICNTNSSECRLVAQFYFEITGRSERNKITSTGSSREIIYEMDLNLKYQFLPFHWYRYHNTNLPTIPCPERRILRSHSDCCRRMLHLRPKVHSWVGLSFVEISITVLWILSILVFHLSTVTNNKWIPFLRQVRKWTQVFTSLLLQGFFICRTWISCSWTSALRTFRPRFDLPFCGLSLVI